MELENEKFEREAKKARMPEIMYGNMDDPASVSCAGETAGLRTEGQMRTRTPKRKTVVSNSKSGCRLGEGEG